MIRIGRVRVQNYKSFRDSGWIEFTPGFNVIIGANNAGKTALLQACAAQLNHHPHKSLEASPTERSQPDQVVLAQLDIEMTGEEIEEALREKDEVVLPEELLSWAEDPDGNAVTVFGIPPTETVTLECQARLTTPDQGAGLHRREIPGLRPAADIGSASRTRHRRFRLNPDGQTWEVAGRPSQTPTDVVRVFDRWVRDRCYLFEAERFNVGRCSVHPSQGLQQDAGNLASVLLNLRAQNRVRFGKLVDYTRAVFPEIQDISTRLVSGGNEVEVRVWHIDPDTERENLTIPLSEAGTGLGQVLGILYLIVTSTSPRAILIDEPQSFLHPGALRRLLSILRQYEDRHQFILSTHAPAVISATEPSTIVSLSLEDGASQVSTFCDDPSSKLEAVLAEVGVRPSDLFGADRILWVEGRTEEQAFPPIIEKVLGEPLMGTQVLAFSSTGDLDANDDKVVRQAFDIHRRMSTSPVLVPPALAFVVDRERRTAEDLEDLRRECPGDADLFTLPRRMFENHLLDADAIATVLSEVEAIDPVGPDTVASWIEDARTDRRFVEDDVDPDADWIEVVRADKLLGDLFTDLTDGRLEYRKVEHGRRLTDWIIDHHPEGLEPVAERLGEALEGAHDG